MELPRWLRELLDKKPSLLNRTAAEDLKRMFANGCGVSEKYREATMKAIELIDTGVLSQIRMVSEIERIVSMELDRATQLPQESMIKKAGSNDHTQSQSLEPMFFVNKKGKPVGKLKNNGKKITLTLSCSALNDDQEKALHEFVNNLVKAEENKS
ncbi:MAG: hypothetical protein QX198_13775 [Methylococcaceae bacterium]